MARKMKLWGGLVNCDYGHQVFNKNCENRQHRCLVKATSQKRAVELINTYAERAMSVNFLRTHWSETGNSVEIMVGASTEGEGVWVVKGRQNAIRSADQYTLLKKAL